MSDRILAKSRQRRRAKKRWRVIQSLFFAVILASSAFILLQSSLFNIKQIEVEGIQALKDKEVRDLADIGLGENILKVNLEEAQKRISLNPLVKSVKLERKYPSKVVVTVEERDPIGIIPTKDSFMAVDREGVLIRKVERLGDTNLPLITGIKLKQLNLGSEVNSKNFTAAVQYIEAMPDKIYKQISEVNVAKHYQVIVYTMTSAQIRLGSPEKIDEKMKMLETALKNSAGKEIEYIDISYEGQPVFKIKDHSETDVAN